MDPKENNQASKIENQVEQNPNPKSNYKVRKVFLLLFLLILISVAVVISIFVFKRNEASKIGEQIKIQNSYSTPTTAPLNYNLEKIDITKDLEDGPYYNIHDTDLEIKIPGSYKPRKNENDGFIPITPFLSLESGRTQLVRDLSACNSIIQGYGKSDQDEDYISASYCNNLVKSAIEPEELKEPNPFKINIPSGFLIAKISTTSSVMDWVLDNFHPQGIDLRKTTEDSIEEKKVVLNGNSFYGYILGCCAGGEAIYFFPYETLEKDKIILAFVEENSLPKLKNPSIFLNAILSTLRKKTN
jgi:hypothetical protein